MKRKGCGQSQSDQVQLGTLNKLGLSQDRSRYKKREIGRERERKGKRSRERE